MAHPGSYTGGSQPTAQIPSPLFDGTRLGLEGAMLSTVCVSLPAGLHIALSAVLGYARRLAEGPPAEPGEFTLFSFLFAAILAIVAMSMAGFFLMAIPTMAYSMGLTAFMLRWIGRHRRRIKLTCTIITTVLGLLVGIGGSIVVFFILGIRPTGSLYAQVLRWPEILSIDGIALLWFSLYPLFNAIAGARLGWRLGAQFEEATMLWYW